MRKAAYQAAAACRFFMPRAKTARGKEPGRCPRPRQGGSPPETPRPLSLLSDVPERSSPSRVRYGKSFQNQKRFSSAAHKPRALDGCGPFRKPTVIRERGQMQSQNHLHFGRCTPPVGRPRAIETQRKDKTRKETRRRIASLHLQAHSSMRKCWDAWHRIFQADAELSGAIRVSTPSQKN